MPKTTTQSSHVIEEVVAQVREHVARDQRDVVEEFVRQYYAGTDARDLAEFDVANLYGAALAHWNFAHARAPGTPKLRVYNPQLEQDGWQSTHTIVEIVTDDMPFLVDSVRMALNARGLTTHLVIHPVMRLARDERGRLTRILGAGTRSEGAITEAIMHLEVDRHADEESLSELVTNLQKVLRDVRVAVEDWKPMRGKLREILAELEKSPPELPEENLEECIDFLKWIDDDHFTFLGYDEYTVEHDGDDVELKHLADSSLGLLRGVDGEEASRIFSSLPAAVRRLIHEPRLLVITKASNHSTVHRPSYLDHIGIKQFDASGKVVGWRRFLGLYTSAAYNRSPRAIPLLREKVFRIVERADYPVNSHAAKALINILETFPRDLLFQIPDDELFDTAMGILHLQERQRIRLFVHRDRYGRFFSCIVYVPRERFNTEVREAIQDILAESLGAIDTEFTVELSESVLARIYFVLRVPPGHEVSFDVEEMELKLRNVTRVWRDDLHDALLEHYGEEHGLRLYRRYGKSFRADYRVHYSARIAAYDIEHMETLADGGSDLAMSLYRPLESPAELLQFKLFHLGRPIPLSEGLPMLENMGLEVVDERPSKIKRADGARIWMHDFGMSYAGDELDIGAIRGKFEETFANVWYGRVENDGFNRLVLRAGLAWREIVVLRGYCKYLRQAAMTFSQTYMERALAANPLIARLLVELFHTRFDPAREQGRAGEAERVVAEILSALDEVASLDEDRILRSFLGVIQATLRTNFYQRGADGEPKSYVSFKFDPARVPELPDPRPMFEIFVYSPRVEGVHLRGGPVARGGLRWSDRPEDFRTEVLGLVKAQMVKNAVIVPVGSKGGFVPKRLPAGGDREAIQSEGVACYRIFIQGLLDITDNLVSGNVVPPAEVVRHDGDDPYLVVAADKGTATFSDIANGIAKEYGFWLGDAFASGGSQGYDHKGMGITARGAWESVKRHFSELGIDTQTTEFTVIGIGDMSGDVFGNGMLLSRHIRLLGAFNHLHVFLDPDPDPEASFKERERLFAMGRSTWQDYDAKLISKGGGVFARSAKSIPLTPEVRAMLDTEATAMAPNELIRAMLKAPVDLLWNGGIGTYVKASFEHNDQVGDRSNDNVRIDAAALRCRVVGEGGNLGFTQLGRIEFAANGGRVNTDAIDNSAGVDCSDHEVNIKILLNEVIENGDMTEKQRNALLSEMTDEVARLVLRNNYLQTQALSLACAQAPALLEVHARLIRHLEREGELVRAIEYLPDKEEIDDRISKGRGLTSPELAVLLAYMKIRTFKLLLASDLPDEPFFADELVDYFPTPLGKRFRELMPAHRLSREIISTVVANEMVNRSGVTGGFRLGEETGAEVADIARAYMIAREVFGMRETWRQIESLDNVATAASQIGMLLEGRKLLERSSRWLLRNRPRPLDVAGNVEYFRAGVTELGAAMMEMVPDSTRAAMYETVARLIEARVPEELAATIATFDELSSALDIVEVAKAVDLSVSEVGLTYFQLGEKLDLHWMRDQIIALERDNRWQALARAALRDDLYAQQRMLTRDVLSDTSAKDGPETRIDEWMQRNAITVHRCRQILADLMSGGRADFVMLSVAMREIRSMRAIEAPQSVPAAAAGPAPTRAKKSKPKGKRAVAG
ncbi:MAG: NAD-glutamate dehydrogenase [Gammaproteobacteria bacterium]|nr:NAD-glutamate dehydrogenase [Gammaproteobacteria bacterium]